MSHAPRLGRAGVLMGLVSVIALSCSSDIVELLPLTGGASTGGGGGSAGEVASGASTGGSNASGSPTTQGGFAGATHAGGGNGGSAGLGCFGFGCAGASSFGGSFGGPNCGNTGACTPCLGDPQCPPDQHCSALLNNVCVQCATKGPSQCKTGYNCDVLVGRCAPSCDSTFDCSDDRVCDPNLGTCVSCLDNHECEQDGDPRTSVCYLRRCVECTQHSDCLRQGGEQHWCSKLQCVQCLSDKDCDPDGRSHCDVPKGFCQ